MAIGDGDPRGKEPRSITYDAQHLRRFVATMSEKLRANAHKGSWDDEDPTRLANRLWQEFGELRQAMLFEDPEAIRREAADVGNFAMMLHSLADRIVAQRAGTTTEPC